MVIVETIHHIDEVMPQADMEKNSLVEELGSDAVFFGFDWKGIDA